MIEIEGGKEGVEREARETGESENRQIDTDLMEEAWDVGAEL